MKSIVLREWEVQAFLEKRKTRISRVIKPQPIIDDVEHYWGYWIPKLGYSLHPNIIDQLIINAPYQVGDEVWCKETWGRQWEEDAVWVDDWEVRYKANRRNEPIKWHPAIQMPIEYSRLRLRILDVRAIKNEQWEWEYTVEVI